MTGGEVEVKQRIRDILRFAGVLLPAALVLYGLIIDLGTSRFIETEYVFSLVMIPWLIVSLLMFAYSQRQQGAVLLRLGVYHFFVGAYIVLISGFSTPFVALGWVLLLLASYIYLSHLGLLLNLLTLVSVVAADIILNLGDKQLIITDIVSISSIAVIGAIIVVLNKIQQADSKELLKSKAQESLQSGRMNTLINNLADAVININDEGKIELYNAASLNLLNTNVSLYGQSIDDVVKTETTAGKRVKLFEMIKKARSVRVRDDLLIMIDDEPVRLEVTASPVRSSYSRSKGESPAGGYVMILRDITKAKSLEEERDEFISVVSHELRTPITVAEGTLSNIQLMFEKGKTPPGTIERSLSEAHEQIVFLSRMVNDLSTLSRAEQNLADTAEDIDVKRLITSLYKEYAPQASRKKLHFDMDIADKLGTVHASELYLRELLQNLITNAIKYTHDGSITLHAKRDSGRVIFEIKDTGIGISKGDQAKIFDKFYRSEDYRTRETGGTGLGLYVASKLARKLSTTIEVKSRLNHGSVFSFSLPTTSKK